MVDITEYQKEVFFVPQKVKQFEEAHKKSLRSRQLNFVAPVATLFFAISPLLLLDGFVNGADGFLVSLSDLLPK